MCLLEPFGALERRKRELGLLFQVPLGYMVSARGKAGSLKIGRKKSTEGQVIGLES